jgi:hypothetical protein
MGNGQSSRPGRPVDPAVIAKASGRFLAETAVIPSSAGKPGDPEQLRGPPLVRLGYTIAELCLALRISQATYFELKARGLGPREMSFGPKGTKKVVFIEEAIRWCRSLTAAAGKDTRSG